MRTVTIDFETRSACDLPKCGGYVYSEHGTTGILCLMYKFSDEDTVHSFVPRKGAVLTAFDEFPEDLRKHIKLGGQIWAHNAAFEEAIWNNVGVKRLGWPKVHPSCWACTAGRCAAMNLPRRLNLASRMLNAGDQQKDESGKGLIKALSIPQKDGTFNEDPELLEQMYAYCRQDVVAEFAVDERLHGISPDWSVAEWSVAEEVNRTGVQVDVEAAKTLLTLLERFDTVVCDELSRITDGYVTKPTERKTTGEWLNSKGYPVKKLDRETLEDLVNTCPDEDVVRFAEFLIEGKRSSSSKVKAFLNRACADGRARGSIMYCGASATGRFSAVGLQLHNIPRGFYPADVVDVFLNKIVGMDADEAWHYAVGVAGGETLVNKLVCSSLRGLLTAGPGKELIISDYSAIEVCVLAWMAEVPDMLGALREERDVYKQLACTLYDIDDESKVDKSQRQVGKMGILGCGYGMGFRALMEQAGGMGVDMDRRLSYQVVKTYRQSYPEVVQYWHDCEKAAISTVETGQPCRVGRCRFSMVEGALTIELPSGRMLWYHEAKVIEKKPSWAITYAFESGDTVDHLMEIMPEYDIEGISFDVQGDKTMIYVPALAAPYFRSTGVVCPLVEKLEDDKTKKTVAYSGPKNGTIATRYLYGGLIVENIVQATARDLLMNAITALDFGGLDVVLHVHDEVVVEADRNSELQPVVERVMRNGPSWSSGLPLRTEAMTVRRYQK